MSARQKSLDQGRHLVTGVSDTRSLQLNAVVPARCASSGGVRLQADSASIMQGLTVG